MEWSIRLAGDRADVRQQLDTVHPPDDPGAARCFDAARDLCHAQFDLLPGNRAQVSAHGHGSACIVNVSAI